MNINIKNNMSRWQALETQRKQKKRKLQSMSNSFFNLKNRKKIKKEIQAIEEGQRDILNTTVTQFNTTSAVVNKNNYKTYGSKVQAAYAMYNSAADYGGEVCRSIVETRVSFIGGEGIAVEVIGKNRKAAQKWIDNFCKINKLKGSTFLQLLRIGELDGKALITLQLKNSWSEENKKDVFIKPISWHFNRYNLQGTSHNDITGVSFGDDKKMNPDKFVYVHMGGMEKQINSACSRTHCVLTDIENFSRAKYDLRENTHLYGKIFPYWKTASREEAIALNNSLNNGEWEIGTGYAGTADVGYVEPSGQAAGTIEKDMINALKCISMTIGIPVHFLAYPEMLSNRATAENLMEMVVASTRADKVVWQEAITELIEKARIMAVDAGEDNAILAGDIQVKIPVVSLALLKQITEVWYNMLADDIISLSTFREMLPGIDAVKEEKQIENEKQERMKKSPFLNNTFQNQKQTNQGGPNDGNQGIIEKTENN